MMTEEQMNELYNLGQKPNCNSEERQKIAKQILARFNSLSKEDFEQFKEYLINRGKIEPELARRFEGVLINRPSLN